MTLSLCFSDELSHALSSRRIPDRSPAPPTPRPGALPAPAGPRCWRSAPGQLGEVRLGHREPDPALSDRLDERLDLLRVLDLDQLDVLSQGVRQLRDPVVVVGSGRDVDLLARQLGRIAQDASPQRDRIRNRLMRGLAAVRRALRAVCLRGDRLRHSLHHDRAARVQRVGEPDHLAVFRLRDQARRDHVALPQVERPQDLSPAGHHDGAQGEILGPGERLEQLVLEAQRLALVDEVAGRVEREEGDQRVPLHDLALSHVNRGCQIVGDPAPSGRLGQRPAPDHGPRLLVRRLPQVGQRQLRLARCTGQPGRGGAGPLAGRR